MQSCVSDVKAWATANMLELDDSKTELMLVTSKRTLALAWTIGVGLRMSTLDSNVAGSIPASICFLLEQETLSALLQSTQL